MALPAVKTNADSVIAQLTVQKDKLFAIMPPQNDKEKRRLLETAFTVIRQESLSILSPESLLLAIYDVLKTGLDPDPQKKLLWVYPRDGKACVDYSSRGYIELGRKAGLTQIIALLIYENDEFEVIYKAGHETFTYNPHYFHGAKESGELKATMCSWIEPPVRPGEVGRQRVVTYDIAEIYKLRDKSPAWNSPKGRRGPWAEWPERMVKAKTVRQTAKDNWPMTGELARAIHTSDMEDAGEDLAPVLTREMADLGIQLKPIPPASGEYKIRGKDVVAPPPANIPEPEVEEKKEVPATNQPSALKTAVLKAIREGNGITVGDILDHLSIAGLEQLPGESGVKRSLTRMVNNGEITEEGGRYYATG